MQIKGLHKNIYRLYRYSRTQECLDKYRKLYQESVSRWEEMKKEVVSDKLCKKYAGISRATYFRRRKILEDLKKGISPPSKRPKKINKPKWGEIEKQLVLNIRMEHTTYGKEKIAVIIKREYKLSISESTVGRILKHLKETGLIQKSASALRTKRRRNFSKGHAKPWTYKDYAEMEVGERVQIDHMTATKNGVCVKHFAAWDRKSKYMDANVYSNANSSCAKRFLLQLLQTSPIKIKSIQVDGGSEFMKDFESECEKLNIGLFVLPPKRPDYNGGVERTNRIFREEFYNKPTLIADSVRGIQAELTKAIHKYNNFRPHHNLKGLTPMQYIKSNLLKVAA